MNSVFEFYFGKKPENYLPMQFKETSALSSSEVNVVTITSKAKVNMSILPAYVGRQVLRDDVDLPPASRP